MKTQRSRLAAAQGSANSWRLAGDFVLDMFFLTSKIGP
jgi:hypothetical protein